MSRSVLDEVRAGLPAGRAMPDVLVVGIGTGELVAQLAGALPGVALLAVDPSPPAVEAATQRGVTARLMDVEHLLAPDASYDVVVWVQQGLVDPGRGEAELRRVLRAEGRLVVVPVRWPAPPHHDGLVRLAPLTSALLGVDTEAYVASPLAIAAHSAGRWPTAGFDISVNRGLVARHEAEHAAGEAFAYAILDADDDRELGCAYLRPLLPFLERSGTALSPSPADAAVLTYWAIDDVAARPPGVVLLGELLAWAAAWGAAPVVLRVLPEETESLASAVALGLRELSATGQELPYRWFVPR